MQKSSSFIMNFAFFMLAIILFFYGVIEARDFLYPIFFGVLIAYLLYPLVNFLEKHRIPRIIAILFSILLAILVIGALVLVVFNQFDRLVSNFPAIRNQALANIENFRLTLESLLGISIDNMETVLKRMVSNLLQSSTALFNQVFTATAGTVFKIGIMPVYVFLFLFYRTKFAYFILKLTKEEYKLRTLIILRNIAKVATHYMGGVFFVVCILCVINSFGLYIIGIRHAIILGILSAFFNFIPYFGTLLGGAVPLLYVLLTSGDPTDIIKVLALFAVIQFTENNILTPNIVGSYVHINPFFIILGLIVGSIVWGIPGMLVVVPSLAIFKIVAHHVPKLEAFDFLLGMRGTRRHAFTFGNIRSRLNKMFGKQ